MLFCLIACRSLTYAQRSARELESAGYSAYVTRMPAGLSESGCGYAVKISKQDLPKAVGHLRQKGFAPKHAFLIDEDGRSIEVSI